MSRTDREFLEDAVWTFILAGMLGALLACIWVLR